MNRSITTRRQALCCFGTAALTLIATAAWGEKSSAKPIAIEVWKDPSCGCCQDWIDHMQANGFAVTVHESGNSAVRAKLGLPVELGSCHTALVDGYVVEGHVPASDVHKLLRQRPKAIGITAPGMPIGSPGMDGAVYGGHKDSYDVLLVSKKNSGVGVDTRVFSSYR